MRLKGGFSTEDPRLDRIPQFDTKNLNYPIRTLLAPVAEAPPRSYTWRLFSDRLLDQGHEGACVGFGWTHELEARPVQQVLDADYARMVYREAQKVDEWPGEAYEGTSVLAGAKVIQGLGHMVEYRWAFTLGEVIRALGYRGPVVLGLNWYTGMMEPDIDGYIHPTGNIEGGHCVLTNRVQVRSHFISGPNSWGPHWGPIGGFWRLSFDDFERLLRESGDACIPVSRMRVE